MKEKLLSRQDMAQLFGCSVRSVDRMRKSGELPEPTRVGDLLVWSSRDISKLIRKGVFNHAKEDDQSG